VKRILVIRLLSLEVAPLLAAAVISAYAKQFAPATFLIVAIVICINIALSIRDSAVLAKLGYVVERRKERVLFWMGIRLHISIAACCLFAAAWALSGQI